MTDLLERPHHLLEVLPPEVAEEDVVLKKLEDLGLLARTLLVVWGLPVVRDLHKGEGEKRGQREKRGEERSEKEWVKRVREGIGGGWIGVAALLPKLSLPP